MAKPTRAVTYGRPASNRELRNRKKEPPKSAAKDKTIKQLLGEMYGDRVYLEVLLKETGTRVICYNAQLLLCISFLTLNFQSLTLIKSCDTLLNVSIAM